jgi:hypothetical protein
VFVERQDQRVVELRHMEPSPREPESALGLAANSEHLYVGYAYGGIDDVGMPAYASPGHLVSISKQDGQVTSLLDDEQGWLAPITADDQRVIVFAMRSQEMGFYQVPLDHPRLEALPLGVAKSGAESGSPSEHNVALALWDVFLSGQLVGDQVYWVSIEAPPVGLLRSRFDDAEPELLSQPSPWGVSLIGPGYTVTTEGVRDSGYHYLGLDFVRTDDSGCRSVQGPRGEVLGAVALDARHAYWFGYRTSESDATLSDQTLHRVDLETGAVARLNAPSLTPDDSLRFVAQDDTHLFLGKSERSIMKQTGHRSASVVRRYIRDAELFDRHASAGAGLRHGRVRAGVALAICSRRGRDRRWISRGSPPRTARTPGMPNR